MSKRELSSMALMLRPDIRNRSIKVALVVGTILGCINHGDSIVAGTLNAAGIIKIMISYCVPYSVSTWSSVQTAKDDFRKQQAF